MFNSQKLSICCLLFAAVWLQSLKATPTGNGEDASQPLLGRLAYEQVYQHAPQPPSPPQPPLSYSQDLDLGLRLAPSESSQDLDLGLHLAPSESREGINLNLRIARPTPPPETEYEKYVELSKNLYSTLPANSVGKIRELERNLDRAIWFFKSRQPHLMFEDDKFWKWWKEELTIDIKLVMAHMYETDMSAIKRLRRQEIPQVEDRYAASARNILDGFINNDLIKSPLDWVNRQRELQLQRQQIGSTSRQHH